MRGHLLELETTIPLSTEKLSTGSPEICHCLILTGSPSVALSEKVSEQGNFFSLHSFCHSLIQAYVQDLTSK